MTKRGLTQEQLAQEFFVTRQLISKWENDKSYPDLDQVVNLSEYFKLPLDYLLKEDHKMVEELSFSTRRKRILQGIVLLFSIIILAAGLAIVFLLYTDKVPLQKDDIIITRIEKKFFPRQWWKINTLVKGWPCQKMWSM